MKVIFLLSRIEKSGVAIHTLDLAQGLIARGHELILITGGLTDPEHPFLQTMYQQFEKLGVQIILFDTPKGNVFRKLFTSLKAIQQITSLLNSLQADIIHSQSPYMTFLPWLVGKKFVTTVHNVQLRKNLKYKNPTQLIAISEASRDYAIAQLGISPDKVTVVCHGVSERYAQPVPVSQQLALKEQLGIDKDALIVGYAGRISREKGLDQLVETFGAIKRENNGLQMHLLFLGDYYTVEDEDWFSQLLTNSDVKTLIHQVPFQDPKPMYDIIDVFVLPSLSEAFGLVCVEAMMSSCCTIRTNTNGAVDQIDHGENGFIYPIGDLLELKRILKEVLQETDLRNRIAMAGKAKALKKFTIDIMAQKTEAIYASLIQ